MTLLSIMINLIQNKHFDRPLGNINVNEQPDHFLPLNKCFFFSFQGETVPGFLIEFTSGFPEMGLTSIINIG